METLSGTVQLSGFAASAEEKAKAEQIARYSRHVKSVRNDIVVRPRTEQTGPQALRSRSHTGS